MLGQKGENCISVASGANAKLTSVNIEPTLNSIKVGDIILIQLEEPVESVLRAAIEAKKTGAKIIKNPKPAYELAKVP